MLNDLTSNSDLRKQIDSAILDFCKAFDPVLHKRLLHKLKHYGIQGPVIKLLDLVVPNG